MKKFKMGKTIQIRISDNMENSIKQVGEFLQLDKPDLVRMLISNGLRYWKEQMIGETNSKQFETRQEKLKEILEVANTKWVK